MTKLSVRKWRCPTCGYVTEQPAKVKWVGCGHPGRKGITTPVAMKEVTDELQGQKLPGQED